MVIRVLVEIVCVFRNRSTVIPFLKNNASGPYKLFRSYIIAHWYSMAFLMAFLLHFMDFSICS